MGFLHYNGNQKRYFGFRRMEGDKMELREQILSVSTELFQEEGLRFTMQEVAASLHISKKTIYTIYPSKEELLLDMVDALFADIHQAKKEQMAADLPIEERIEKVIVALPIQYSAIDFRLMDTLNEKYPSVACRVREHLETNWEPTLALLREGIESGQIRPVALSVLRQMITASIECFLCDGNSEASYADTLAAMMDIIMNGIRRRSDEI